MGPCALVSTANLAFEFVALSVVEIVSFVTLLRVLMPVRLRNGSETLPGELLKIK